MKKIEIVSVNEVKKPKIYPLGPLYIAKSLEKNYIPKIYDFGVNPSIEDYIKESKEFNPDMILLSIRNIMNFNSKTKKIVEVVKNSRVPYLIGGPAITVFKDHAINFLKIPQKNIFYGNFNQYASKILPDIINKSHIQDLTMPDGSFTKYTQDNFIDPMKSFGIVSQVGCPYNCIYCSYPNLSGREIQSQNVQTIAKNLERLLEKGISNFFFADPVFNINNKHSLEISQTIKREKYKAKFGAFINPRNITKKEAQLWAEIGMKIELGIDGLNEKSLKAWNKGFNKKDVINAINILNTTGVDYTLYSMLSAPNQTIEDVQKELDFLEKLNPPCVEITVMPTIYPETNLYDLAIKQKVIKKEDPLIPAKTYCPPTMDKKRLTKIMQDKMKDYKQKGWGIIYNQYTSNPTL